MFKSYSESRQKINSCNNKSTPVVISGPSGSGKSTLVKMLMEEFPEYFAFSVSHTTRQPRPGEQDGIHYHFVSREDFQKAIGNGNFLEYAEFSGNLYGTSKMAVEEVSKTGRICILDVDTQGVKSLKKTNLRPTYIFIQPPDVVELEKRLRSRGTEKESHIKQRLQAAQDALEYAKTPGVYDHVIVNDNKEVAYSLFRSILSEDMKKIKDN